MKPKVYAHASYVGTTGYNNHTRDFFRQLSKHIDLKVRNFTIGKEWNWPSDEPHNGESYLNDIDKKLLAEQTLWTNQKKGERTEYPIYKNYSNEFKPNINLVLEETNHHYYYDKYIGPKIAYNVWESTLQPEQFFNKLKEYDQIWVPSKWQAECTIAQGMPADKIKIVPEGVDVDTFYPEDPKTILDYVDGRFKFVIFGRWDYRKSTKELIETFLKEFKSDEPVDLIVSINNPFSGDGHKTTEERLKAYGFTDERIKVKHFPSREDYITYMKNGHVFLSCARSEGWNLPLIEAMACGTPSIYSACCAQMEFAEGKGLPVKVLGERPALDANYNHFNTVVGNYYEPDFEDLARVMRDAYVNYNKHKKRAIKEASIIHRDFNWEKIGEIGAKTLQEFTDNYQEPEDTNTINISFISQPKVEILGNVSKSYLVEFINADTNQVLHSHTISNNMWTICSKEYYIPWLIKINGKIVSKLDLNNKRVLISIESNSIGDTIAWTPYAVEFAKKHNCKVILSTFHNDWFKEVKAYKDIEFIKPGEVTSCVAHYKIGWFRSQNEKWDNFNLYPNYLQSQALQKTSSDILGLEFKELNYRINFKPKNRPFKNKYIAFAPESTAGCKEWSYDSWIILAKMLKKSGYEIVILTNKTQYHLEGIRCIFGKPLQESMNILYHAEFLVGLSSGLSWINWSLGKHTVMISGFTAKEHEFQTNITRIQNEHACNSCWANTNFVFDPGDWDWCPIWKGTDKQHICQKSINPLIVFNQLPL